MTFPIQLNVNKVNFGDSCTICTEPCNEMDGSRRRDIAGLHAELSHVHPFHGSCISAWASAHQANSGKCPTCRKPFGQVTWFTCTESGEIVEDRAHAPLPQPAPPMMAHMIPGDDIAHYLQELRILQQQYANNAEQLPVAGQQQDANVTYISNGYGLNVTGLRYREPDLISHRIALMRREGFQSVQEDQGFNSDYFLKRITALITYVIPRFFCFIVMVHLNTQCYSSGLSRVHSIVRR